MRKGIAASNAVLASVVLLTACVVVPPTQMGGKEPQTPADSAVVKMIAGSLLPALYQGDLPCADCAGMRYAVDLRPDNVYFMRTTYLGKGGPQGTSFDDIGRYSLSQDARTLTLKGSRGEPLSLYFENSVTLRVLDRAGQPIQSDLNYYLKSVPSYHPIEPRLSMRGMYSYMADAGRFRECLTQLDLPVAQSADNRALESAYGAARAQPGQPVMVSLEGRIAMQPKVEGEGLQPTLIVEKFGTASPGESC